MPNRVTFYIDGFNFYNGLKDTIRSDKTWKKYYWLDFVALANQFLDNSLASFSSYLLARFLASFFFVSFAITTKFNTFYVPLQNRKSP